MSKYTIILEYDPEAKSYAVTVPALPGCTSQGYTIEEAIANAKEAIGGHVATLRDIGEPVPEEIERPQAITIDVAA
ncbi:MAG: type II toxin-antitoxin system HicB family antitoxin [Dehalococcoidia bacterium]|nr:type II toxin-antitoxin system HicB family antitoxin [Dehalococcoidia bacterium]